MNVRRSLFGPLLVAMTVLLVGSIPALAAPPSAALAGIDDPRGDPNAAGVNVIRKVDSSNSVIVRLTRGNRSAHFEVHVRGVDVVGVDDLFSRARGLESDYEDGLWGSCRDELITDFDSTLVRSVKRGMIAQAKFCTCVQHDSIRIHLVDLDVGGANPPAIRIVFTEGILDNVDGVFVGDNPTDVGDAWISLDG